MARPCADAQSITECVDHRRPSLQTQRAGTYYLQVAVSTGRATRSEPYKLYVRSDPSSFHAHRGQSRTTQTTSANPISVTEGTPLRTGESPAPTSWTALLLLRGRIASSLPPTATRAGRGGPTSAPVGDGADLGKLVTGSSLFSTIVSPTAGLPATDRPRAYYVQVMQGFWKTRLPATGDRQQPPRNSPVWCGHLVGSRRAAVSPSR
jgi:hypothetical protein